MCHAGAETSAAAVSVILVKLSNTLTHLCPSLSGFWTDCKLPDYEEVIAHPPTPPPPYSESPPDVPVLGGRTEAAVVLEPPVPETAVEVEEDEEPNGRRRHVTGDSGIEVCVCQLDEGSGPEEESLCQGADGGCCSECETLSSKELSPEPAATTDRRV